MTLVHPDAERLRAELQQIEERLLDPAVRADPDALRAKLAVDFVEFSATGQVLDRDAVIAALMSESQPPQQRVIGFKLRARGDTLALTTCRVEHACGSVTLRSSTWRRTPQGEWQMVFHQGTPVPQRDEGTS